MNMQSGGPPQMSSVPNVLDQTMMSLPLISVDEEPPNKKMRSEDNLIPEEEFISKHKVFIKKAYNYNEIFFYYQID